MTACIPCPCGAEHTRQEWIVCHTGGVWVTGGVRFLSCYCPACGTAKWIEDYIQPMSVLERRAAT